MVQSTYCRADVGYVDLNVRNTGVITDFFINTFKGMKKDGLHCTATYFPYSFLFFFILLIDKLYFSFHNCSLQTDCGGSYMSNDKEYD